MASAWGKSWGLAWGNSWGVQSTPPVPVVTATADRPGVMGKAARKQGTADLYQLRLKLLLMGAEL